MGHKISKEQIDPSVKDHIMSFVGDITNLETDVNSDIISAVNSLIETRVDNIENIGKIAGVIGDPVTASDSIDEVVVKISELITQIKITLMNNGVSVESGDKLKQLITKVEGMKSGGLDIISATELPATGKENQICVITDNPTDVIIISPDSSDQVTGSIYCNISHNPGNTEYTVTSGNMIAKYNMLFFAQDGNTLASYIYQNGAWTQFTNDRQFFMKNIAFTNNAIFGGYCNKEFTSIDYGPFYSAGKYFYARNYSSFYTAFVSSNNKINFDNFSHAAVELYAHNDDDEAASGCPGKVFVASTKDAVFGSYMSDYIDRNYVTTLIHTSEKHDYNSDGVSRYYEFDLTSWTGEGHFTLFFGHTTYCPFTYIKNIYLY